MVFEDKYSPVNYSNAIVKTTVASFFAILLIASVFFFSKDNLLFGLMCSLLPIPIYFLYIIFKDARIGFISVFFANYFSIGLSRYIPAPLGLAVDGLLVLTFLSIVFSQFNRQVNWNEAGKDYTYIAIVWFLMTFMQLFNPEAVSREAWFYAMRAYALYIILAVPITYLKFNRPKDLELFIKLLAWFTVLAVLKGLMQKYIGVDHWEKQWLNVPGNRSTHILFGQLRVFSFFSDAGTYGGSMGYFGVLFIILAIHEKKTKTKLFYYTVGVMSLYAMLISGTRSAISVPLVGFSIYTVLTKNFKIIIFVSSLIFSIFFFLKYTTIAQGNYDVRRMRSAFNDDNASMNVRTENRILFAEYLKSRPFGGGVGSAGNWGMRFSPHTFLAQTATDGWYIQIWAEQGIVGLAYYLFMILYILMKSSYIIFFKLKSPIYIYKAIGLVSGLAGLMASSYTASSLGQMPNTIIIFTSAVFISLIPKWEQEEAKTNAIINKGAD